MYLQLVCDKRKAFDVSSDERLGLAPPANGGKKLSLKILRWLNKIADLPAAQRKILFQTIDTFFKAASL